MNKKYLLSVAAAASITMVVTGCGNSSSSGVNEESTATLGAANHRLYNYTVECDNAEQDGYETDKNKTAKLKVLDKSLPVTNCVITDGQIYNGVEYIDYNVTLEVDKVDTSKKSYANPMTTAQAGEATDDEVRRLFGLGNDDPIDVNTEDLNNSVKGRVAAVSLAMKTAQKNGVSAKGAAKEVAKEVEETGDLNSTSIRKALNTAAEKENKEINSTEVNATADLGGSIKKMIEETREGEDTTVALQTALQTDTSIDFDENDFNNSVDGNKSAVQDGLKVFYLDKNVTFDVDNDAIFEYNATAAPEDINVSNTGEDMLGNLRFTLRGRNLTDDAYTTADITLWWQNEGNDNLTYKTVFEDVNITEEAEANVSKFTLQNNTNVSVWISDADGVTEEYTFNAEKSVAINSGEDINLTTAISTDANPTDVNMSLVTQWVDAMAEGGCERFAILDVDPSKHGGNANFSFKALINIDDYTNEIYTGEQDGNLSKAKTDDDFDKEPAVIFEGKFIDESED